VGKEVVRVFGQDPGTWSYCRYKAWNEPEDPVDTVLRPKKYLIVGPSWVGDMVMAHSLVQTLQKHNPGCMMDLLAPAWSAALLERMPGVHGTVDLSVGHGRLSLGVRRTLGLSLRGLYDHAIVLPNSWKSALVPFFARIPRRTGYLGEFRFGLLNDLRRLNKIRLPMTVQRFVALGLPKDASLPPNCPSPLLRVDPGESKVAVADLQLNKDRPVLTLCPGAEYGPAKRWPAEHFAQVGRVMRDRGWTIWVMGSEKDREGALKVCTLVGKGCVNLAGRTSLAQAVDLLALASAVVSNDSGLMHVAAALQRPLVAVYGSSDPEYTPPLSASSQIVTLAMSCSPCFKRECPLGHGNCLQNLDPEQVLKALDDFELP
jgi:heptosyltransferase II